MKFLRHTEPDSTYTMLHNVDYMRSRKLLLASACVSQSMAVLFTGSILAGYLQYLGIPTAIAAVLMQIPLAGGVAQLFAPKIFTSKTRRAPTIRIIHAFYRYMMAALGLIPLLFAPGDARIYAFATMILLGYFVGFMADSAVVELISNLAPRRIRGRFIGQRDSIMVLCGSVCSFVIGSLLDVMRSNGAEAIGFAAVFIMIFLLETADFIIMGRIKEPPIRVARERLGLRDILTKPIKNREFRRVIIHHILWNAAYYVAASFLVLYLVGELKYKYSYIAILTIISTVGRVIFSRFWGRISERKPWNFILAVNLLLLAGVHTLWFFSSSWLAFVLLPIAHFFGGIAMGGIAVGNMNIQIMYSPQKQKNAYICMNAMISSITGFVTAIAAAAIADSMKGLRATVGLLTITNQQVMFMLSAVMLMGAAFYSWKVLKPDNR